MPNRRMLALGAVLAAAVVSLPPSASAQEEDALPWVQLSLIDVDPARVTEFLAVEREMTALAKKAKVPWRLVSRTETFGDIYRFLVAVPAPNLASFDEPAMSGPEWEALLDRARSCITGRQSLAVRALPEIDNPLPEGDAPDLMVINITRVAPGREAEYLDIMSTEFLPHFADAEVHHVNGALAFGGASGFIHVFYVENFAELDLGSPVMRALGTDGARAVTEKLSGIVTSNEQWIARLLPEASYTQLPEEPSER